MSENKFCLKIRAPFLNVFKIMVLLTLFATASKAQEPILPGAYSIASYVPLLKQKKVALVVNHTSEIEGVNLVDTLLKLGIDVRIIFSPEHGFRGNASAGEKIADDVDSLTKIPIKSLYGNSKKPSKEDLKGIDIVVFDLQDVGTRFYTYISTMVYVMEACVENKLPFVVLDRPNPNGYYMDGPMMQKCCKSFVGLNDVPVVHGMTVGEYALMANGEKWLNTTEKLELTVIPCQGYSHTDKYVLPVSPSPNLPNQRAIFLYPSLCFFEGTVISVGRGTDKPFQQYGHPKLMDTEISFIPKSTAAAINPPCVNEVCYGFDLSKSNDIDDTLKAQINLSILINAYQKFPDKEKFFNSFFKKLAGNEILEQQIKNGMSENQIRATWKPDLERFKQVRKKYLLYPDFE